MRAIRIIRAPLTSCITLENLISFKPISFICAALGWRLYRQGGLSLIYLYSSKGKERGEEELRGDFTPAFSKYKNICKLKTQELQVRCKWNLHDICTVLAPLIYKKWGCESKGRRGRKQISTKKCHEIKKISTLTSSKSSSENTTEIGIFLLSSETI